MGRLRNYLLCFSFLFGSLKCVAGGCYYDYYWNEWVCTSTRIYSLWYFWFGMFWLIFFLVLLSGVCVRKYKTRQNTITVNAGAGRPIMNRTGPAGRTTVSIVQTVPTQPPPYTDPNQPPPGYQPTPYPPSTIYPSPAGDPAYPPAYPPPPPPWVGQPPASNTGGTTYPMTH